MKNVKVVAAIILDNNKIQDIDKIYNDIQYRNKLMEEYKIYERI